MLQFILFNLMLVLFFGLIGACIGYKLGKNNYQFKKWQIFLVILIFACALTYGVWLWNALRELGQAVGSF